MKNCILLLALVLSCAMMGKAQVTIPDANFVLFLNNNGYASCLSGNVLNTSCAAADARISMDCSSSNINNLTGVEYFTNVTDLRCGNNQMTILNALPPNLTSLDCSNNLLNALPIMPLGIQIVNCGNNNLSTLPAFPNSLATLNFQSNTNITAAPGLPYTLKQLYMGFTSISSIVLPDSLQWLHTESCLHFQGFTSLPIHLTILSCTNDTFRSLPALPATLKTLSTDFTPLTSLPTLPSGITSLSCRANHLSSLPTLPSTLLTLDCGRNTNLHSLPALPNLTSLYCQNVPLYTLPPLPATLNFLYCSTDSLTSLPASLPPRLMYFECDHNYITNMPPIPTSMYHIKASNNQLTTIPALNDTLTDLDVSYNNVTSFSNLPSNLSTFDCSYNLNLTCLPQFQKIVTFRYGNTGITCLPTYGTVTYGIPPIASVPLCGIFNTNGCGAYWNLSGQAFYPLTNTCVYNSGDIVQANIKLQLYQGGVLQQQVFTGGQGLYSFNVNNTYGTYVTNVDTTQLPFTVNCPGPSGYSSVISALDSLYPSNNFAFKCKTGIDLGVTSISEVTPNARPGHVVEINLTAGDVSHLYGANCAAGTSGVVKLAYSNMGIFQGMASGGLAPTSVANDTITWLINDFGAVNNQGSFRMLFLIDSTSLTWTDLNLTASITTGSADYNPSNDTISYSIPISNSFDPNEKEVYPRGPIDTTQKWLTYTVHFQNTGNASALNIYVLDTLDANLDASSIELLSYGHQNLTQVLPGGIVRFNFPNINLPDSTTNEPASHGYIQYKIRLKNGLAFGTVIHNTANIYFDFNAPIATNTTSTFYGRLKPAIATTQPITFCQGDSVTLHATGTNSYPVQWLNNGAAISSETNSTLTAHAAGTYSVRVYYAGDSATSTTVTVTVNALPNVTLGTGANIVCANGTPIALTPSPAGGIYFGAGVVGNTFDPSQANLGSSPISYTYTDGNNCSNSATASITVNALPTVSITADTNNTTNCQNPVQLNGTPSGGSYAGSGVVGSTFNPQQGSVGTDTITYSYTDSNTCSATAKTAITNAVCVGIENITNQPNITVYPNPTSDVLNLMIDGVGNYTVHIYGINGILLETQTVGIGTSTIDLSGLASGMYYLEVGNSQGKIMKKVVKM